MLTGEVVAVRAAGAAAHFLRNFWRAIFLRKVVGTICG